MYLFRKLEEYRDFLDSESDKETDEYIDKIYFRLVRFASLYPHLSNKYLPLTITQISIYIFILLYHTQYLFTNGLEFLKINFVLFSQDLHFFMLEFACIIIMVSNIFHKHDFARLHKMMKNNFFDYQEDNAALIKEYKKRVVREKIKLIVAPVLSSVNGFAVMLFSRFLDNYGTFDKGKYDINFDLPFPGKYSFPTDEGTGYYIALAGQAMCLTIMLPLIISCAGFIYITMTMEFIMQLRILLYTIENLEQRTQTLYHKETGKKISDLDGDMYTNPKFTQCFHVCLKRSIQHHQILLSAFNGIQGFCGINLLTSYMIGSIMIGISANCVSADQELPGTTLSAFSFCLNEIFFMALLSHMGQMISDLSEEIREKCYQIQWYRFDESIKKELRIFREATLTPITLMAAGMLPVNMNTFSQVMNSAYTYYNLLNATK